MNWGCYVQKFLFTFFESNIEAIVKQDSLQLFTYETADYLATIYFRTDHNFQKQLLTGGSNSSKETAVHAKNIYLLVEFSLCYPFNYQISKVETSLFRRTGHKEKKNFRWNLDIPRSKLALNRDFRNIPLKENISTRTF